MSYSGLGVLYQIPTSSDSALFPNMTLTMDVPVQQVANDVIAAAWPNVVARLQQDVPSLVTTAWPTVLNAAQQSMPPLVKAAWPSIQAEVPFAALVAWKAVKPDVQAMVVAEERKAALVGTLTAAALLGAGYWVYRRLQR